MSEVHNSGTVHLSVLCRSEHKIHKIRHFTELCCCCSHIMNRLHPMPSPVDCQSTLGVSAVDYSSGPRPVVRWRGSVRTGSSGGRYVLGTERSPNIRTAKLQQNILGTDGLFVLMQWQQAALVGWKQQIAAQFINRNPLPVFWGFQPHTGLITEVQNL